MKVEIYGTPWCGYCNQAKRVCESNELEYTYTDVDNNEQRNLLEARLEKPISTVPQIFVDDKHVGGYTEFVAYLQENS